MPERKPTSSPVRAPLAATPKIAIVCHSHPSVSKGGAEIAAYALYRGLRDIGVDSIFIAACSHADRHRLALGDDREFAVFYDAERYEYFYQLAPRTVEEQLVQIVRDTQVEVVNFHHFLHFGVNSVRAVRAIPGVRCYYSIHEYLAMCHNHGQMVTRPAQLLCPKASPEACIGCFPEQLRTQFAMRNSTILSALGDLTGYISPSRFLAERYIAWGLIPERMTVIENGLLGDVPPPRGPRADAAWTFGYFGQINPFKGVDVILEAAEQLALEPKLARSMRIRVHGNLVGQTPAFLERFGAAQRNLPFFSYAGQYNSNSVYRLMSECDYVLVPSRWWENSPVVVQEAFAARVPVICSGIGGLAEKVANNVSGLHFKLGDAADLVRAMKTAADAKIADKLRVGIPSVASAADTARDYMRLFSNRPPAAVPKRAMGETVSG